jgi:haloalkane dehalogenase
MRCVAPDLIGMGASGKPTLKYRFVQHAEYLAAFLEKVVPKGKVLLVVHDWGSALGFDWAFQHQDRILGLAFFESLRPFPTWDSMVTGPQQELFRKFRDPVKGRKLIVDENFFIDIHMRKGQFRQLSDKEMDYYSRPYQEKSSREPIFRWPNEIPIEGKPADVAERMERYHEWLLSCDVPKLFFWATPGRVVSEEKAHWYLGNLRNVKGVYVGQGMHYLQEDHPSLIGESIAAWKEDMRC